VGTAVLRQLDVDLTGSKMGPLYRSVVLTVETDWTDGRLRYEAARHYEVPLNQVGQPREVRPQP
jgi:hypothetical protein